MVGGGACGGGASWWSLSIGLQDAQSYIYTACVVASRKVEEGTSRNIIKEYLQESARLAPSECRGLSGPSSALCQRSSRFLAPTQKPHHGRLAHRLFLLFQTLFQVAVVSWRRPNGIRRSREVHGVVESEILWQLEPRLARVGRR
jgi:hypothetical protein